MHGAAARSVSGQRKSNSAEAVVTQEQRLRHARARQARHAFLTTSQRTRDAEQALQRSPPLPPLPSAAALTTTIITTTSSSSPCAENSSETAAAAAHEGSRHATSHRRVRSAMSAKTPQSSPRLGRAETRSTLGPAAAAHSPTMSAGHERLWPASASVQHGGGAQSSPSRSPLPRAPLQASTTKKKKSSSKVTSGAANAINEKHTEESSGGGGEAGRHRHGLMARVHGWLSRREGDQANSNNDEGREGEGSAICSPTQVVRSHIASPLYRAVHAAGMPGLGSSPADTLLVPNEDREEGNDTQPRMPLSPVAWAYCVLNALASLIILVVIALIAAHEWQVTRTALVHDGGACEGMAFVDRTRPDLTFTLLCFAINGAAAVWFAVQGAYWEKAGSLVGQLVTVALQLGRIFYFIFYVAQRYCGGWALMGAVRVLLLTSASAWVIAVMLSWWVWRGFGWRPYIEGIAESGALARRKRYVTVQTCLQLDAIVTLNAYLTMLFLFDAQFAQLLALGMTLLVLVVLATLLPLLRRTRHWAPLLVALLILGLSMSLYTFVILSQSRWSEPQARAHKVHTVQYDESDDHVASVIRPAVRVADGDDGMCYARQLQGCLRRDHVYIVLPSLFARHTMTSTMNEYTEDVMRNGYPAGWVNDTSTYLPTKGLHGEYFELRHCNASCFAAQGSTYVKHIASCCASYGRCRLKDGFRIYSVALLASLAAIALLVRLVLARNAWRRYVEGDDAAAEEATRLARRLF